MRNDSIIFLLIVSLVMAFQVWIHHLEIRSLIVLAANGDIAISKAFDLMIMNKETGRK